MRGFTRQPASFDRPADCRACRPLRGHASNAPATAAAIALEPIEFTVDLPGLG
jgi:hypothetical protein